MKVLLVERVESFGNPGDVKDVAQGYARNFLFPRKLAIAFSEKNRLVFEQKKKKLEKEREKELKETSELALKIDGISVTITRKAGDDDKLFGSVTNSDIADAMQVQNFIVDRRKIELEKPIKELGIYNVKIKLLPEKESIVKVWVVRE